MVGLLLVGWGKVGWFVFVFSFLVVTKKALNQIIIEFSLLMFFSDFFCFGQREKKRGERKKEIKYNFIVIYNYFYFYKYMKYFIIFVKIYYFFK